MCRGSGGLSPNSHPVFSAPAPSELGTLCTHPCARTFPRTFEVVHAAQRAFPPRIKCSGPISEPKRQARTPPRGCSQSHLWLEAREDVIPKATNQVLNWKGQWNGWECSMKRWSGPGAGAGLKGDRMCSIYGTWFKMLNGKGRRQL